MVLLLGPLSFGQGRESGPDSYNLAYLGAQGMPVEGAVAIPEQPDAQSGGIDVLSIYPIKKSVATTIPLAAKDRIVKVDDAWLAADSNPAFDLAAKFEAACKAGKKSVKLGYIRGDKLLETPIPLPGPAHADKCPAACPRCKQMGQTGLEFLKKFGRGEQMNENAFVVSNAVAGMCFLASGSTSKGGPFRAQVAGCANYVMSSAGNDMSGMGGGGNGANWNQTTWSYAYGTVFLCELYDKVPDPKYLKAIERFTKKIIEAQEATGGWAHGPGGPNALGYLELTIVGDWCLLALGMAEKCGVKVPEEPILKAVAYMQECSSEQGGLGYSHRSGQKGYGSAGRNALAVLALQSLSYPLDDPYVAKLIEFYRSDFDKIEEGHPAPAMHILSSAWLAHCLGGEDWQRFMDKFRVPMLSLQRPDGGFAALPTQETKKVGHNNDRDMTDSWSTAHYAQIFLLDGKKIPLIMGKKPKNWVKRRTTVTETTTPSSEEHGGGESGEASE